MMSQPPLKYRQRLNRTAYAGPAPNPLRVTPIVASSGHSVPGNLRCDSFSESSTTEFAIVEQLRLGMPLDAICYFDRILSLYWTVHYLNVYAERSFFQSAEFGTLGWAFPGAPGAVHRGRRRHHADLSGTRDSVQVPHPGDAARGQRSGLRPEPPQHPARRRSGRVRPTPSARPTSSSWRVRWAYPPDAFAAVSSSDGSQLIELPVGPLAAPPRDGYGAEHRNHQACPLTATGIPDPERSTSAA
jgi:hypothetical protein